MSLSKTSRQKLQTCHSDLIKLVTATSEVTNIAVICGHRGKYEQEQAFLKGKSKAKWGQSKHNKIPSMAVDIVPLPLDWNDIPSFEKMGETVLEIAKKLNIKIKWGRDFSKLKDYPHFELVEEE